MLGPRLVLLAGALALLLVPAPAARGAAVTPAEATALGREAYLYGFPLIEVLRVRTTATSVRCPDGATNAPVNVIANARAFARPQSRTVVAPNVDTLYSLAQLDLGRGPVVLSHPDMGDRYFVFQFLDPYTNTFAYVGSRTTGSRAGRFALTWSGHRGRRVRGAKVIRSPSRRVWMIGRTLASTPADQRRAHRLMDRYRLTPLGGARRLPHPCRPGRVREARTPRGLAFVRALNRALVDNPPPARDRPLLRRLARVGIGPGRSVDRIPRAIRAAVVEGVRATAAALPGLARKTVDDQAAANRGWATPKASIGDYGTDYTYRAGVATLGLGANTREEALYPTAYGDEHGVPLDGRRAYRLTFARGQEPPARAFWSLTLYDGDGFLFANPDHRYAIGDSHPPLRRRADGSIVVALQRTRPAEPDVNWLPTPPGPFRLNLRLYDPAPAALSGAWQPPPVVPADGGL